MRLARVRNPCPGDNIDVTTNPNCNDREVLLSRSRKHIRTQLGARLASKQRILHSSAHTAAQRPSADLTTSPQRRNASPISHNHTAEQQWPIRSSAAAPRGASLRVCGRRGAPPPQRLDRRLHRRRAGIICGIHAAQRVRERAPLVMRSCISAPAAPGACPRERTVLARR